VCLQGLVCIYRIGVCCLQGWNTSVQPANVRGNGAVAQLGNAQRTGHYYPLTASTSLSLCLSLPLSVSLCLSLLLSTSASLCLSLPRCVCLSAQIPHPVCLSASACIRCQPLCLCHIISALMAFQQVRDIFCMSAPCSLHSAVHVNECVLQRASSDVLRKSKPVLAPRNSKRVSS